MRKLLFLLLTLVFISCQQDSIQNFDVQGHRGARGVLPENTIEGFIYALESGVSTLEMDVAVSKDNQAVVSHEPYFSYEIATKPNGEFITKEEQYNYNMYQMSYDSIRTFDVGLRPHPRFENQKKQAARKPLLSEVIKLTENYSTKKPFYNIEIKRHPDSDNIYHPNAEEFAELVVKTILQFDIIDRVFIQSFDVESIQDVRKITPEISLVLLVENNLSFEENIDLLGFIPDVYSPDFNVVNPELVSKC